MKQKICTLLILTAIGFSACQKEGIIPVTSSSQSGQKGSASSTTLNQGTVVSNDTTKGYLRVQLAQDSVNTDNILIKFSPAASANFSRNEDAPFLQGMGSVSFSSLSADHVALAINQLPLVSSGTTIGLAVSAKATGVYKLNLLTISAIPSTIDIWLKDNYKKDSLDFRNNPTYAFNLTTTDTSTYGSHRFSLVLRSK